MSYKFTLDHTLEIENIQDMITIDIKPDTRCLVAGSDVEIHGYLTFDGSYLTDELGEERFAGTIPLDITLPYLGGAPDVRPEVASFDYKVTSGTSLTLSLEILLKGYQTGNVTLDGQSEVMDAWVDPVAIEPIIEEAVIEPFDVTLSTSDSVATPINAWALASDEPKVEVAVSDKKQQVKEEAKKSVSSVAIQEGSAEEEAIPYSPLVAVDVETVELEPSAAKEQPIEVADHTPKPPSEATFIPTVKKRSESKLMTSAAALMDELFAMKRGIAFKEQVKMPVTTPPKAVSIQVIGAEPSVVQSHQAEPSVVQSIQAEPSVVQSSQAEPSVAQSHQAEPPAVQGTDPVVSVDSVARQFADGESTIKMVYVRHESETLGGLLERYSVTLDDVWNLPDLADGVGVGDCVMIKYEQSV